MRMSGSMSIMIQKLVTAITTNVPNTRLANWNASIKTSTATLMTYVQCKLVSLVCTFCLKQQRKYNISTCMKSRMLAGSNSSTALMSRPNRLKIWAGTKVRVGSSSELQSLADTWLIMHITWPCHTIEVVQYLQTLFFSKKDSCALMTDISTPLCRFLLACATM